MRFGLHEDSTRVTLAYALLVTNLLLRARLTHPFDVVSRMWRQHSIPIYGWAPQPMAVDGLFVKSPRSNRLELFQFPPEAPNDVCRRVLIIGDLEFWQLPAFRSGSPLNVKPPFRLEAVPGQSDKQVARIVAKRFMNRAFNCPRHFLIPDKDRDARA